MVLLKKMHIYPVLNTLWKSSIKQNVNRFIVIAAELTKTKYNHKDSIEFLCNSLLQTRLFVALNNNAFSSTFATLKEKINKISVRLFMFV